MNLRLAGAKALPEDGFGMRIAVAAAVEIGLLAVAAQNVLNDRTALLALALAPIGYVVSYRRRRSNNVGIKVLLACGLFIATARFLGQIGYVTSPDAARAPLAALFLWVQVLHAFDVPRRRDLAFSMVSSTTMIAVGGALALSTSYLWWLLAWAVVSGAWLWMSSRPLAGDLQAATIVRTRSRQDRVAATRSAVAIAVAALVTAVAVFAIMPRVPVTMVRSLPFRMSPGAQPAPTDRVQNPGLPQATTDGQVVDFSSNGYPGFSDVMDLRARGQLSDDIVFRVRAAFPQLWRAEVFDTYDGSLWTESRHHMTSLVSNDSGGYDVPGAQSFNGPTKPLVQTFFLQQTQPNVLFGAAQPQTVYFPSGALQTNADLSIRAPFFLDQGLVYSVESSVPAMSDSAFTQLPPMQQLPQHGYDGRYLQLPTDLPQRDRDLAAQITAGTHNEYDAVMAVQSWLQANTQYDLDRAAGAAGRRRGRSLPVRHTAWLLRAHRLGDGGPAAGRGDPDADRDRVRTGGAEPVHRLLRGPVLRRARVGGGAVSGTSGGSRTTRRSACRRCRAAGAPRWEPASSRGSPRRSAPPSRPGCGRPSVPRRTGSRRWWPRGTRRCRSSPRRS